MSTEEFDDIARINALGTSILNGLTASLREGNLIPNPGGGFTISPGTGLATPVPVPGQEPPPAPTAPQNLPVHVLMGSSLLATFEPEKRAVAQELVEGINEALEGFRKKQKAKYMADIRKLVGAK
jgi:hypothetical protein